MKFSGLPHNLRIVVAGLLFLPTALFAEENLSHARVVRLSFVSGTAALQRPGSTDWAKATVNTPIQEGFVLSTSETSFAEVEFENGSTARLGEFSKVEFNQLALDSEGNKLNRLTFEQGYGTFHFMPEHHDVYSVQVADATVTPDGKAEFRTDFRQGQVRVEVFKGSVKVAAASQSAKLGKDKILEYTPQTDEAFNLRHGIEKDSWDKWTEARDTQAQLALKDQAVRRHGPLYGWSDLGAYGEWADVPGFGYGWAPYAALGWSPFSMGMWDWYPGFGWTWISSEPWGWLPYHYGLWNYAPGFGWFWMPRNFGFWSPALVTWYTGPGWVGWAPVGTIVRPRFNSVTAVPTNVLQSGQTISSQNVMSVKPGEGTVVRSLPVRPTSPAMLPGNVVLPVRGMNPSPTGVQTSAAGRGWTRFTPAPATVLMGGNPAAEKAFMNWNRSEGPKPQALRAPLGTTLGGHFPVAAASTGASQGAGGIGGGRVAVAPRGSASSGEFNRPGPTVLPRGGSATSSGGSGGTTRGASASAPRSGGGGYSGGMSSRAGAGGMSSAGRSPAGGHR